MILRTAAFEAIGTHWDIRVLDTVDDEQWQQLLKAIEERISQFDQQYSRFRSDSLVTRMSQDAGTYELPNDGYALLSFYERLYHSTEGRVTPLIGQVMVDAGYDADYSFQPRPLQKPPRWEDVLRYDEHTVALAQPALLDFGAAGKGYLVDIVAGLIDTAGFQEYTINAGGDIRHRSVSGNSLKVGLENPQDTSEAIGIANLQNASLCASSGSKRTWGKYHHILDPYSLQSIEDILATWVMAADAMTADGLATALFFKQPEALRKEYDFTYGLLHKDMRMDYATDFPVTLFEVETQ